MPLLALAIYLLGWLGLGRAEELVRTLELAAIFAGLPTILTAGGVARMAARVMVAPGGGWKPAVRAATIAMAVFGPLLALLVAMPIRPPDELGYGIAVAVAGAVAGAIGGAVLGLAAGYGAAPE